MAEINLKYSREILISLEANMFSDTLGQLKSLVTDITANVSNRIKDINYYIKRLPEDPKVFFNDLEYLDHTLRNVSYIDIRDMLVPIPENFVGNYLEYSTQLTTLVRSVNTNIEPLIKDYKVLISSIINNGGDSVILKDYNDLYSTAKQNKAIINSSLAGFLTGRASTAKIGNLLHNLNQLTNLDRSVFSLLSEIKVNEIVKLNKDVDQIHQLLEMLVDAINNKEVVLNKNDVLDIGNGAFILASYLEAIAMLYYSVNVFINRVKDLYTTVIKKK